MQPGPSPLAVGPPGCERGAEALRKEAKGERGPGAGQGARGSGSGCSGARRPFVLTQQRVLGASEYFPVCRVNFWENGAGF